jgi:glycosyltransferase involved in cell wall biosynthesis
MEITGIKYTAPFFDGSGYAEASRQYIKALHSLGVPLTLETVSFEPARPDLGETGKLLQYLLEKNIPYNIKITHLTPEHYSLYREGIVFNIGYSIWETSKLHPDWPIHINGNMDLAFVGCDWNIDVYRDSGVTIPLVKIPHGIDVHEYDNIDTLDVGGVRDDDFMFYSIFQWTERKHPMALIKSYWATFKETEKVALVLKTYRSSYAESEKEAIRETIKRLRKVFPLDGYPPIYLITDILSREDLLGLHKRGDCFTLFQRSEGFGLPHFEAAAFGNPIITTGMGGNMEFTQPDNSYLVDFTWTPVFGMPWCPWYRGDQWWAEPDLRHASKLMRHVFENRDEATERGRLIKKHVSENLSWEKVARRIINTIREV